MRSDRIRSNPARGLGLPRPWRRDYVLLTHGQALTLADQAGRWRLPRVALCAIALTTRPEGVPLTGLSWRATQSGADEAPIEEMTCQDRYRPFMCQTAVGAQ